MPERPIDNIAPGSDKAATLLQYLLERLEGSEEQMSKFYHRWAIAEMKYQAYIELPDYEKAWKEISDTGAPPNPNRIIVPFGFAAISTLTTFLLHTFYGRRPHAQLGVNNTDQIERARRMEQVLQSDADKSRMVRRGYQEFLDIGIYGIGAKRINYVRKTGKRTLTRTIPQIGEDGATTEAGSITERETRTVYEGNEVTNIDPFMFFPDWRVPMAEVSRRGEFAFWRTRESKQMLKRDEWHEGNPDGTYSYVNKIKDTVPKNNYPSSSRRSLLSRGNANPGDRDFDESGRTRNVPSFIQLDQGAVWIVPSKFGLSDSDQLERWIFTIANKGTIIQAEHFDADHEQLPITVSEPFAMGYAFGSASPMDYIAPIQDLGSWLVNSHIENVRTVLNNVIVYDPFSVEETDMRAWGAGARIRLRQDAFNRDLKAAVQQIPVADVTQGHLQNLELVMRLGMLLLGFNQNIMGQTERSGNRTTATESRQSAEAGVSRLAAIARIIASESMADTTYQQVLNIQQFMTEAFWIQVLGNDGRQSPLRVNPDEIVGEYQYVIHDGTLPLDRVALLNVWKELTLAVAQDQELRQRFDVAQMFEYSAELAGARNIEEMRRGPESGAGQIPGTSPQIGMNTDEEIARQVQAGNLVPAGGLNGSGVS